eukprot:2303097-Amphidinium_carterae.1
MPGHEVNTSHSDTKHTCFSETQGRCQQGHEVNTSHVDTKHTSFSKTQGRCQRMLALWQPTDQVHMALSQTCDWALTMNLTKEIKGH